MSSTDSDDAGKLQPTPPAGAPQGATPATPVEARDSLPVTAPADAETAGAAKKAAPRKRKPKAAEPEGAVAAGEAESAVVAAVTGEQVSLLDDAVQEVTPAKPRAPRKTKPKVAAVPAAEGETPHDGPHAPQEVISAALTRAAVGAAIALGRTRLQFVHGPAKSFRSRITKTEGELR